MQRADKIRLLKQIRAGLLKPKDITPAKLCIALYYDELPGLDNYFINGKKVSSDQYRSEFERQQKIFGSCNPIAFIGNASGRHQNSDPLPDFCKRYIEPRQ
jgi:hypothetical protein